MYIPPEPDADVPSWLRLFARPLAQYGAADYVVCAVLALVIIAQAWPVSPLPSSLLLAAGAICIWAAEELPPHRLRLAALLRFAGFVLMLPAQFLLTSYMS